MSLCVESVDDLLNAPEDSDDPEIGDIGAEQELALLDDDYEGYHHGTVQNQTELDDSQEAEVLDLESTDIIEEEPDECDVVRQSRFQAERPVQQVEVITKSPTPVRNWNDNKNKRSTRGGFRNNNYHNITRRNNFQNNAQNKRVLINPHFKGQVPIRNNISLVWDKNLNKKPLIHVQPWAQNTVRPQQNNPWNQNYQLPHQQQIHSSGYLTQQKIGVPPLELSNIFIPPVNTNNNNNNNQQYHQPIPPRNIQQPFYEQQPIYPPQQISHAQPQYGTVNGFNQFTTPYYNNNTSSNSFTMTSINPVVESYPNATPFHQPVVQQSGCNVQQPRFEPPPINNHIQRTFTVRNNNSMANQKVSIKPHRNFATMGPQARKRFSQHFIDNRPQQRTNLQEVKVADYIPLTTKKLEENIKTEIVEEEDEGLKRYRLLIQEQKKLREKILKEKEERRKNAAAGGGGVDVSKPLIAPEVLTNSLNLTKTIQNINNNVPNPRNVNLTFNVNNDSCTAVDKNAITSFLSNRKIIAKDEALPDTSIVVVSNLATGSTEVKLRKLCKGVGDVKNLVMSPIERQATIEFKSVASAHTFYKKYQRFMLDLSMIQVVLKKNTK